MSELLIKPKLSSQRIVHVTPRSAGWEYVGLDVYDLRPQAVLAEDGDANEVCVVLLSGSATLSCGELDSGALVGRESVFDGLGTTALYVPPATAWQVVANDVAEIAVCKAPGGGGAHPPRLIGADRMSREKRGSGSNVRHVCNILPEDEPAASLLVVEVTTPAGSWSSYPPHKHDTDNLPHESRLEEVYYHRINPPQGYVHQRIYTADRALDVALSPEDRDVVLVPRGYHPVGVPHGYESYYLNVMAGPKRVWRFANDPAHEWMLAS